MSALPSPVLLAVSRNRQLRAIGHDEHRESLIERARLEGYSILSPGHVEWFSADDWEADSFIAIKAKEVGIVFLFEKLAGTGARGRLCCCARKFGVEVQP